MVLESVIGRRAILQVGLLGAVSFAMPSPPRTGIAAQYRRLRANKMLSELTVLALLPGDDVLTEGPACDRDGMVYFTHVRASQILKWDSQQQVLSVFREHTNNTNGMCFDARGRLLCCEGGAQARRITRQDMTTGAIEVLADRYDGRPLAAPNDICVDHRGRIYFTSRGGIDELPGISPKAVYRIDPDGSLNRLLVEPHQIQMPNGVEVSADGRVLYVIETHPDAGRHRDIRAFDLDAAGQLSNERVVIDFYPGRSGDGMSIDAAGNLYVAAGLHRTRGTSETLDTRPGIHVISPHGKLLAFCETPEDILTSCTFGGDDLRTLYITGGALLMSMRTAIPGSAIYRPQV
jgi:gluconolactonase